MTLAVGAKEMALEGGIVTHLTALEEIASMVVLCSDKTGTLTHGEPTVTNVDIFGEPLSGSYDGAARRRSAAGTTSTGTRLRSRHERALLCALATVAHC